MERIGACDQCKRPGIQPGQCCRLMYVYWPGLDDDSWRWLLAHEGVSREGDYVIFHNVCRHLTAEGDCSIYEDRPKLCKEWPYGPDCLVLVPACAYRFEEEVSDG